MPRARSSGDELAGGAGGDDGLDVTHSAVVTVPPERVFDSGPAWRLARVLEDEDAPDLRLDFSAVGRAEPRALGILVSSLARRRRVVVVGLSRHDLRILSYLGVRVFAAGGEGVDG